MVEILYPTRTDGCFGDGGYTYVCDSRLWDGVDTVVTTGTLTCTPVTVVVVRWGSCWW